MIALRVGVGDGLELSAWLFPPAEPSVGAPLLLCSHGGTLTKHYWHLEGHPGYSFAEHMARLGFAVVAFDQLGVGESSVPADLERVLRDLVDAHGFTKRKLLKGGPYNRCAPMRSTSLIARVGLPTLPQK